MVDMNLSVRAEGGKGRNGRRMVWYVFVTILFGVIPNLAVGFQKPKISFAEALPSICLLFFKMVVVGMAEEMVFRGLLFRFLRKRFGESKRGIWKSVFVSAGIFGLAHLANLWGAPAMIRVAASQVICAASVGVLLAVLRYHSGHLSPGIAVHVLIDFSDGFWACFATVGTRESLHRVSDISTEKACFFALISLPFALTGILQLQKIFRERPEKSDSVC